jgi:hypothetical protein
MARLARTDPLRKQPPCRGARRSGELGQTDRRRIVHRHGVMSEAQLGFCHQWS